MIPRTTVIVLGLVAGCSGGHGRGVGPEATVGAERTSRLIEYAPGIEPIPDETRVLAQGFVVGAAQLLVATDLAEDECVRFDLGVSNGVSDGDLAVHASDGRRLAGDAGPSRFAATVVCTREPIQVRVRATAARGAGEVAIAARRVSRDSIRRFDLADEAISTGRLGADETLRRRVVEELGPRGFRVEAGPLSVQLEADVPTHVGVAARAGECVVVKARSAAAASLRLTTASGQVLADDEGSQRDLGVSFCSVDDQALSAVLVSRSGTAADVLILRGLGREVGGASAISEGRNATAGEEAPPADSAR